MKIADDLIFHIPTVSEMSFRQELLSDKETMSYNNKWGGTIDFPKTMWENVHKRLTSSKNSFYAYLFSTKEQYFIGEASYHYSDEFKEYIVDVIVHSKYRNKGYGSKGLLMLCDKAKENGILSLADNIALDNSSINIFLKLGFKEIYKNQDFIFVKKIL